MKPLHISTPILESQSINDKLNKTVYFKLEALQPAGSFKLRGIGRLCQNSIAEGYTTLVASSGGNAGVAVAYCGMKMQIPTTIFIPKTSHQLYINKIQSFGARVIISGETAGEAQVAATAFAQKNKSAYIHPYDHPEIWAGHATIIDEVVHERIKPDAVIVSVGGGGLACGLLEGMNRHGWTDTPLIAVETVGADVFSKSMQTKAPVHLQQITSRATSLGATYVAPRLLKWAEEHPIENVVVSDEDAEMATYAFAKDQRILVELASGASLSLVFNQHPLLNSHKNILVIVCGGLNISHFAL